MMLAKLAVMSGLAAFGGRMGNHIITFVVDEIIAFGEAKFITCRRHSSLSSIEKARPWASLGYHIREANSYFMGVNYVR